METKDKKERRLMVPFTERVVQDRRKKRKREKALADENDEWWRKQMKVYNATDPRGMPLPEEKEEGENG